MELDKTVRRNQSLSFKGEAFRRESLPGFYVALDLKLHTRATIEGSCWSLRGAQAQMAARLVSLLLYLNLYRTISAMRNL